MNDQVKKFRAMRSDEWCLLQNNDTPCGPRPAAGQGFTLTEMLVTIAVIVLVAAIAFSGGRSAINSARSAEAVSNLKQTGVILANYVADNNNHLPLSSGDWANGEVSWFQPNLAIYAGLTLDWSKPYFLPNIFYDPSLGKGRQHPFGSFGINASIVLDRTTCLQKLNHDKGRPLISIPNPSHKVIYCSAKEANWDSSWLVNGDRFANIGWQPNEGPDVRYGGMTGALFLDGHVEKLDVKNMDQVQRRRYFTLDP